jgi:anti-sigma B factor antagonist
VTVRSGASHAVIALAGELDLCTAPHLSPVLHGLLSEGRNQITINLDAVTFVDPCALGALLVAYRDVTRAGGSLDISPNRFCERLLAITGTPSPPFRPHAPPDLRL